MNLLEATNALRDAIAKYCAIKHNQTIDPEGYFALPKDDRLGAAEIRLDKALRETHHLQPGEGIEEIHVGSEGLTITTDTGRTFDLARNTRYIA